jgi:hypothetical protein
MGDEIRITVIATGFEHSMPMRAMGRSASQATSGSLRRETVNVSSHPTSASSADSTYRVNDIDVPAFLRKKR